MAPTPSAHRLRRGLPGDLILFAPHAFAPQRQYRPRDPPSPPVFLLISAHFPAAPQPPPPVLLLIAPLSTSPPAIRIPPADLQSCPHRRQAQGTPVAKAGL